MHPDGPYATSGFLQATKYTTGVADQPLPTVLSEAYAIGGMVNNLAALNNELREILCTVRGGVPSPPSADEKAKAVAGHLQAILAANGADLRYQIDLAHKQVDELKGLIGK